LSGVGGEVDLVLANPPYLRDELRRTYRDGGGELGETLSLRIVSEAAQRLARGGTLILYTGAAIVDGEDVFLRKATALLERSGMTFTYEELDPDVFGEELSKPAYASVDRIAAVLLRAEKS
jgi:methylase of polypeptide subunit release factors